MGGQQAPYPQVGRDSPGHSSIHLSPKANPGGTVRVHPQAAGDEHECQSSADFHMLKIRLDVLPHHPPNNSLFQRDDIIAKLSKNI